MFVGKSGAYCQPEARSALEKSTHRIYAMSSFISSESYQSGNIQHVDFGNYLREFLLFCGGLRSGNKEYRVTHEMTVLRCRLIWRCHLR
ncbi:histidine kinase dimerization/phosphoacceptor domain -containing protein, partial [Chitinophaga pinensis]|uniref:histidine kinase dimerization/phosphoacceptor domain -containing protein n=1 Tax=Chitinophaga pinensis TaxID=79329 RepID=UPI0039658616